MGAFEWIVIIVAVLSLALGAYTAFTQYQFLNG